MRTLRTRRSRCSGEPRGRARRNASRRGTASSDEESSRSRSRGCTLLAQQHCAAARRRTTGRARTWMPRSGACRPSPRSVWPACGAQRQHQCGGGDLLPHRWRVLGGGAPVMTRAGHRAVRPACADGQGWGPQRRSSSTATQAGRRDAAARGDGRLPAKLLRQDGPGAHLRGV